MRGAKVSEGKDVGPNPRPRGRAGVPGQPVSAPPRRILVIQLRRIGDVVVTTPVIDALREAFPAARIDFLVEEAAAPVLEKYPGLDEVLRLDKTKFLRRLLDIRRRRYDWVLDFMNNPRTAQVALASGAAVRAGFRVPFWDLAYNRRTDRPASPKYAVQSKFDLLRSLGLQPPPFRAPRIALTPEDFAGAQDWWRAQKLDRFSERVGLVPRHRHEIRQWPAEKFSRLMASLLAAPDRALVLFHGPGEESSVRELAAPFRERVFVIPPSNLRQAASLLARCDVVVTNDSGAMHLAVAAGAPTVTIYGPTWPESWNPRVPPHRWVQAQGLSCVGCNLDRCPYDHECMEWVSPERVAEEVEAVLRNQNLKSKPPRADRTA
ncbi:MAG: glycosyltransferase family 9 protein [Elusimicrobiota bacterium]